MSTFAYVPTTTAYSEKVELAVYSLATSIEQAFENNCYLDVRRIKYDTSLKDILNYPNLIVNAAFSGYSTEQHSLHSQSEYYFQPEFITEESDEDLPEFYNYLSCFNSVTLGWHRSSPDWAFHLTGNAINPNYESLPADYSYVLLPTNNRGSYYKRSSAHNYDFVNLQNRQALTTVYLVKTYSNRGYAPSSWGSPSGGVTGFTNEPNQQIRENLGVTTSFEINWSEKMKENLVSSVESAIYVDKYSFTVNIYRKSDNKKLAHYTGKSSNINPYLLIGVARRYEGTSVRRFGWRDAGNFYIPIDENYIVDAKNNGIIRNGASAVEGTDYVFIPMSGLNNGDTVDFTIDGVTYTCELSRKLTTNSDKFSLYTKNIDYSFSNVS